MMMKMKVRAIAILLSVTILLPVKAANVRAKDADEVLGFHDRVVSLVKDNPTDWFLLIVDENLDIAVDGGARSETLSGSPRN